MFGALQRFFMSTAMAHEFNKRRLRFYSTRPGRGRMAFLLAGARSLCAEAAVHASIAPRASESCALARMRRPEPDWQLLSPPSQGSHPMSITRIGAMRAAEGIEAGAFRRRVMAAVAAGIASPPTHRPEFIAPGQLCHEPSNA